jgi:hypothetical protein
MANVALTSNVYYDTDALAFISAASITSATQVMAINDLVIDLKSFGLWNKIVAVYPMIGGTATSHKFNLKDPRDLDAAYRLVFTSGWTHSATGALPNGTTGYADTKVNASTQLDIANNHMAYYSRTNSTTIGPFEMGCTSGSNLNLLCCGRSSDNLTIYNNGGSSYSTSTVTPYTGLFLGTRVGTGNTNITMYRNGNNLANGSAVNSGNVAGVNLNIYLGAQNSSGIAANFSNKECAFSSIGSGLTASDSTSLYTTIQKYNGYLNRQV